MEVEGPSDGSQSPRYLIRSFAWESLGPDARTLLEGLVGSAVGPAPEFCSFYFDRFYLLHKMGHIVLDVFDPGHQRYPARTEYYANLFALKYLQHKSEHEYVDQLEFRINRLLSLHNAYFDFDLDDMNRLYPRYIRDLKTLAAFHFNSFRRCLGDPRPLGDVLLDMTRQRLGRVNPFVFPRKGTRGSQLLSECCQMVFEFNPVFPVVDLEYADFQGLEGLETLRLRSPSVC
jgi:hypothetical protein